MQDRRVSKSKTKVCYVITKGVWGGVGKYVYALATSLPKDKYNVLVITGSGEILKNKLEEKGVKVYELDSLKRDISLLSEIKSFIRIFTIVLREKPHVLHLNSPKASGIGSLVGRIIIIPKIIQTAHGWSFNEERNIFSRLLIYIFSWITVLLSTKTIVIGNSEKKQALWMPFVNENKITLIRNGIDKVNYIEKNLVRVALLDRIKSRGLPAPFITKDTMWIGTVSELHRNKGLKYTIEALAKVKTPFIFIAIGEGEERENLEHLINEYNLKDKVFLVGFIDIANLYLKAFDIFTLTSVKEGLPYTLLEAGLANLPAIATNTGCIPDLINDGKNGILIKKGDTQDIAQSIEYLSMHPETRKEFGNKLKAKVEKDFNLDQMIKKTLALYK